MKDIIDSTKEAIKERIGDHFYGKFILSWCLCNWEIVYLTVFVKSDSILNLHQKTKLEYIELFYDFKPIWPLVFTIFKLLIIPVFVTYLFISWFPLLSNFASRERNKFLEQKAINDFQTDQRILVEKSKYLQKEGDVIKKEQEIGESKKMLEQLRNQIEELKKKAEGLRNKANEDKPILSDDDYADFKKSRYSAQFSELMNRIYNSDGYMPPGTFPGPVLAYFHSHGIISPTGDNSYKLTSRGLEFQKRYLEDLSMN